MLRITLHQDGRPCRLKLAGRLSGPWVGETENVWRSALCSGEEVEVDVTEVIAVDRAGYELLATMHHAGARLVAKGVWMTTLIREIANGQPATGTRRQRLKENVPHEEDSRYPERR
jgi:ABC-type transporter Mla MlaB component